MGAPWHAPRGGVKRSRLPSPLRRPAYRKEGGPVVARPIGQRGMPVGFQHEDAASVRAGSLACERLEPGGIAARRVEQSPPNIRRQLALGRKAREHFRQPGGR